ncbi:hypothetical protein NEFER03_1886 [Nematocida sp. LUAm3]|nr:hypothetical protein NEFER03_1886 [Nematocida sp. LUAm3]KAI5173963.1 hypothetical protein NEFER02_0430 [Nematocida sp. LUAm2]KAI5177292.1 hypothetical protein NEFER01_0567 [Nematocida sp. LUAm1]
MMNSLSMMANLIISINMHKSMKKEGAHAIIEYADLSDIEAAVKKEYLIRGTSMKKEFARSGMSGKKGLQYKTKVYLGNLSEEFTEEKLRGAIKTVVPPTSVSVYKSSGPGKSGEEKQYAFLEFSSEAERNIALGQLESLKRDGALKTETVISPAYPYSSGKSRVRRQEETSK